MVYELASNVSNELHCRSTVTNREPKVFLNFIAE